MKAPSQKNLLLGFAALLLLSVLLLVFALPRGGIAAIEIRQDGRLLYSLPATAKTQSLRIAAADGGYNVVEWSAAGAAVTAADCPDELCVKRGQVGHAGLPIVCLPHRLSVEIKDGEAARIDAVLGQ